MRRVVVVTAIALVGCARAASPAPPASATTMKVEPATAGVLDVEPEKPRAMPAPSARPADGFAVDDHVGAHAVSRDAAIESIARYDVFGALRVVSATPDVVTFDVLNVDGASRAIFGVSLGQIGRLDPKAVTFAPGQMFVGALAIDPTGARHATASVLVPVQNESEALEVMMKASATALRLRRGR